MVQFSMISLTPFPDFNPKFEVVSCNLECDGKILLQHRLPHKPQGGTWCTPAGKVDPGENLSEAMARELLEETGYDYPASTFTDPLKVFVRYSEYDFIYYIYRLTVIHKNSIVKRDEHQDHQWVTPQEALTTNLIQDEDACIKLVYGL
jgi:8-oxo-dGTP diphosphatase